MSHPAHELSVSVIGRLKAADQFTQYAKSFAELTGLPLSLCSLREWPPAMRGEDCGNAFCDAMLRSGQHCKACMETQEAVEANTVNEPRSVTCLGGICETGVPVRLGETVVGFVVIGPVLLGVPSPRQFNQTLAVMRRTNIPVNETELRDSYFTSPSLLAERHGPVVQMLIVFAEHLSLLADQVLVQQQNSEPESIAKARQFIQEHLAEPLRLKDAARSASLSTSYFSRMFKKSTALGFSEYLARVRVEQARKLLLNPNMHVGEVAFAVGFQSVTHFNRVFKKLTGDAPGEYRQRIAAPE